MDIETRLWCHARPCMMTTVDEAVQPSMLHHRVRASASCGACSMQSWRLLYATMVEGTDSIMSICHTWSSEKR